MQRLPTNVRRLKPRVCEAPALRPLAPFAPSPELDPYRQAVLARMIAGLLLSFAGMLLALVSQSVAARSPTASPLESSFAWGGGLVVVAILALVVRYLRSARSIDDGSDSNRHNLPDPTHNPDFRLESGDRLLDEPALIDEINRYLSRSRRESSELAVMAVGLDARPANADDATRCLEELWNSLRGLTESRGASLLRAEQPEFIVLASGLLGDEALELGDDVAWAVADLTMPLPEAPTDIVTVSVGIAASYPEAEQTAEQFLEAARFALAEARRQGGNRVQSGLP